MPYNNLNNSELETILRLRYGQAQVSYEYLDRLPEPVLKNLYRDAGGFRQSADRDHMIKIIMVDAASQGYRYIEIEIESALRQYIKKENEQDRV